MHTKAISKQSDYIRFRGLLNALTLTTCFTRGNKPKCPIARKRRTNPCRLDCRRELRMVAPEMAALRLMIALKVVLSGDWAALEAEAALEGESLE